MADSTSLYTSLEDAPPYKTILMKGGSGTGKTYKAAHLPRPVYFNFDKNTSGLQGLPEEIRRGIRLVDPKRNVRNGKTLRGQDVWTNFISQLETVGADDTVGTIIIDSLTTMAENIMDTVLKSDNPNVPVQIQHWGHFTRYVRTLAENLLCAGDLDKHVIWLAHENLEKDENTQELNYTLNIGGKKLRSGLDLYFTDVWRTTAERKAGRIKYTVSTRIHRNYTAKCSIPDLPFEIDWDEDKDLILKHFK